MEAPEAIKWIKIDPDNLPEAEVLVCGEIMNEFLVGLLSLDDNKEVFCSGEGGVEFYDAYYYILTSDLKSIPIQQD